ncbi:KTSC domain-containing protein [Pseudoduganella sp. FT26W]|uniref:KTSC domain-containing protein n=1 Tax=Duganella aquatilis TaxID=2666082 RepID=A0A844CQE5_9BURK|nr:KTSC domain-containing protein [Duganella aquatilis]MRW82947.1 KTSC domain-containing protein [Duganella aquatilis]
MHTANSIPLMKVTSSQIAAIGHNPATETLAIQFFHKGAPGNVYHYHNFSAAEYTAFAGAESIGRHFKQHIKPHAQKHPYQNMGVPSATPAAEVAVEQQKQEQAA